jgi:L-arabinose transport system ATP-binding protein
MVEIAKALVRDARVVAFDEPTSSLSAREADTLFDRIAELRAAGKVVLYVSHRMDEIKRICDGATVFRDGQHVVTYSSLENVTIDQLVKDMVGRDITDIYGYTERPAGDVLLEHEGVTVRAGEIVGLFGLVGAGRSELLHRIYAEPRKCIQNGIVLCPEDRKHEGIIPMGSVAENINLSIRRVYAGLGGIWINDAKEKANAEKQVAAMRVKTPSLTQEIRNLSGGNQQKAILGRWLSEDIKVMLLDEPTRGIDVGAKREIYDILYRLAADGIGILMVSSELPEVLGTCDRVYVMRNNRISAEFSRSEATPERCLAAALPSAEDSQ